jgi:ubiquinone/menaquinone biosynthesis C-methylase UbiE
MSRSEPRLPTALQRLFWTLHSVSWDQGAGPETGERRAEEIVRWVEGLSQSTGRLLDLGCGTGELSFAFEGAGFAVTGVDFSPGMLRRARRKARRGGSRIELRWTDLDRTLPFEAASFDAAVCISVLQCLSAPHHFLSEARPV